MKTRTVPTSEVGVWKALGALWVLPIPDCPGYSTAQFRTAEEAYYATIHQLLEYLKGEAA